MYRAFVDNYKVAVEMAEKCCQANSQFAEISEVSFKSKQHVVKIRCVYIYLFVYHHSEFESVEHQRG